MSMAVPIEPLGNAFSTTPNWAPKAVPQAHNRPYTDGPATRFASLPRPHLPMRRLLRALAATLCLLPLGAAPAPQSPAFARFVDDYLDAFARRHPSIAAGNGLHQHDDALGGSPRGQR